MRERDLFIEALQKLDEVARSAYLDKTCSGDDKMRRRVERLLEEHWRQESFILDSPPPGSEGTIGLVTHETCGTCIGPYRLVEQIGEGGFGTVYLAEQQRPVRRHVALKILKPGMDSREVVGRFAAEQQALALMDHPHIAKVLDAGMTETGRPYIVMELVKGVPITEYCDQCSLPMRERLELYLHVCQAVQHAHQKGVIHRDLKPSNVLVAIHDGQPSPKVIDFGVAKAINQRLTDDSLRTGFAQMLGTPLYMSPEQAEMSPLEIDTRGDIYSLGVLLYELLTGTTPFAAARLKEASFDELRRIIREEEPPTPSSRISTLGEAAGTIADQRRTDPRRLIQSVRGDLDWIAMKCLEKDRTRRYETASALAGDIRRFLHHEPVEACPPSALYRLRKLMRRRKGTVIAASLILLALVIGVIGTTAGMLRARSARREAVMAGDQTMAALRVMTNHFMELQLSREKQLSDEDRTFLEAVLDQYERFASTQGLSRESRVMRAEGYHRVAAIREKLGERATARAAYENALHEYRQLVAGFPELPANRYALADVLNNLGCLLKNSGQFDEGESNLLESLDMHEQLAREFPAETACVLGMARNYTNLSNLRASIMQGGEQEGRMAVELLSQLAEEHPADATYQQELARSLNNLGVRLQGLNRVMESQEEFRRALAIQEKLVAKYPAEPEYRQQLALFHNNMGMVYSLDEMHDDALVSYRRAIAIYQALSAEFPVVPQYQHEQARAHGNLGGVLRELGQIDDAIEENLRALAMREKLAEALPDVVDYHDALGASLNNLAGLYVDANRVHDALQLYGRAIDLLTRALKNDPRLGRTQLILKANHRGRAGALMALGRHQDALSDWDFAIELDRGPRVSELRMRRARCLARIAPANAAAEAEEILQAGRDNVILTYEAACVNLLAATHAAAAAQRDQYATRAASLLERAGERGMYFQTILIWHIKLDPDLAQLRRHQSFEDRFIALPNKPKPVSSAEVEIDAAER